MNIPFDLKRLDLEGIDPKTIEVIHIKPAPKAIPALKPMTSCSKTLYGPNIWLAYNSCQAAENSATGWLQGKTSVILESVDTFVWNMIEGFESWGVTIRYTTGGSCYK